MRLQLRKTFLSSAAVAVFFAASALAANHHSLNGSWKLISDRSDFAGGTMVQSATITINDRQHNISISRNFTSEGENTTASFTFDTDARENERGRSIARRPTKMMVTCTSDLKMRP